MSNIDVEILEEMDKILATPDKWAKGYYAYNAFGDKTQSDSKNAVCWCIMGAESLANERINKKLNEYQHTNVYSILDRALPRGSHETPVAFNDDEKTTFRQIKNLIKWAIKLASSTGEVSA